MRQRFPAIVVKEPDSDYTVVFPDFPGCIAAGNTVKDALTLAEDALDLHVRGMIDDSEPIPEPGELPSSLERIDEVIDRKDAMAQGAESFVFALVPVIVPERAQRVNLTFQPDIWADIGREAERRGMSRSAYLAYLHQRAGKTA